MDERKDIPSDNELMLKVKEGDLNAFEEIYRRYSRYVINFAYRMLNDRNSAEEVMQEVFVKVYIQAKRYRPEAKFSTYLFRIVTNHCLNYIRDEHLSSRGNISEFNEQIAPNFYPDKGPEEQVLQSERSRILLKALSELPENQRSAMVLLNYNDMSYEEIAQAIGCSVKAVKSLLHRARESLRAKLRVLRNDGYGV